MSLIDLQAEPRSVPDSHNCEALPQYDAASTAAGYTLDAESVQAAVKQAKLMIVDDEPVNLKAVEKHLRSAGYSHFVASADSTEAMAMLAREQPDLVLLDILMPQVSGVELLRQIRHDARWQCLPVLVLTASCDPTTRREALDAGCTDFLTKPVDPCELALRVRNMLVAKAYYDQMARHAERLDAVTRRQAEALCSALYAADLRYHAGKAEIATDVLHNVGNALNSVNVSVNLVAYTVRDSKIVSLKRGLDLLHENADNLAKFLTKDARGKVLLPYLFDVTDSLLKERDKIGGELELLTKNLKHINAVVATQQKYAGLCNVTEDVPLAEVLSDVDELLGGSLDKHGIEVTRHYEQIPAVSTDRQKLLQVLLNVIKNAVDSLKQAHATGGGRLEIRIGRLDEDRATIEVRDNGAGIPQENLIKIFSHGFTTKRDGHGFGLHSCANMIKELGGSIQALSDGVGLGATFHLELPFRHKEN